MGERCWTGHAQGLVETGVREEKGDLGLLAGTDTKRRKVHNAMRTIASRGFLQREGCESGLPCYH